MATVTALKSSIRQIDTAFKTKESDQEKRHDMILKAYHNVTQTIPNNKQISSYLIATKVRQFRKDLRTKDNPVFLEKKPTEIMQDFNEARKHGIWCLYDDKNEQVLDSSMENVKQVINDYRNRLRLELSAKLDKSHTYNGKNIDDLSDNEIADLIS